MKFYRNHYSSEGGLSGGFTWHTSRRDAETSAAQTVKNGAEPMLEIAEVIQISAGKTGLLAALNKYAGHPDNG